MIFVADKAIDVATARGNYPPNSIEQNCFNMLDKSLTRYYYNSIEQLKFELDLRKYIINASIGLANSALNFAIFRKTKCNEKYWTRANDGGLVLKNNVSSSEAINDIYKNGGLYATECATAMVIVYYKALADLYGKVLFDKTFTSIKLMNWHYLDRRLKEVGNINKYSDYLPGDRRYFTNPDVDPATPEWQGENVIDLGNGKYYGHGVGIQNSERIIEELNKNRRENTTTTSHLLDNAGRPNFKRLADIYAKG